MIYCGDSDEFEDLHRNHPARPPHTRKHGQFEVEWYEAGEIAFRTAMQDERRRRINEFVERLVASRKAGKQQFAKEIDRIVVAVRETGNEEAAAEDLKRVMQKFERARGVEPAPWERQQMKEAS